MSLQKKGRNAVSEFACVSSSSLSQPVGVTVPTGMVTKACGSSAAGAAAAAPAAMIVAAAAARASEALEVRILGGKKVGASWSLCPVVARMAGSAKRTYAYARQGRSEGL
jgi:hypothetical protein